MTIPLGKKIEVRYKTCDGWYIGIYGDPYCRRERAKRARLVMAIHDPYCRRERARLVMAILGRGYLSRRRFDRRKSPMLYIAVVSQVTILNKMVKLTEDMVIARSKGSELHNVKKLNCWGSELTNVSVVKNLPNVEVLSLSVNQISSLEDFQHCPNLQELYIRKNNITDINEVLFLRNIPKLKSLWLADNPCSDFKEYRYTVIRALPHLQKLDNVNVEPEEVHQSMVCGLSLPLPNSSLKTNQESVEMPRSNSNAESLKSESGGRNSSMSDSSPTTSHTHPSTVRQANGFNQSLEEGYEYTQNVYDEDEEQPQMRRTSMGSQHETETYERKSSTSQNGIIPERVDKPPHVTLRVHNHRQVASQGRNSKYYEPPTTSYMEYEEDGRSSLSNSQQQYVAPYRRQMMGSGNVRPQQQRQGSPRRSSQAVNTPLEPPETPVEARPFSRSSTADYAYDSHNANYVSREEPSYPRYTEFAPPCTITNHPTSPTTQKVFENNNNNKNNNNSNRSSTSSFRRPSREQQYREHSWTSESDGFNRERGYRAEDVPRQRDSYVGRPTPQEYRSPPSGEMRHYPQRPSSVGDVLQQHYDATYRRVDQQIENASRASSSIDRPSPTRPYPLRPKTRNANVLSAVLCLIKELDYSSLEVVEMSIRCRMDELDD